MAKLLENFAWGVLDSGVSDTDTTLDSSEFERLPVVEGGDTLTIILDPDESAGEPEIVYVTAHIEDSSSVTVDRAQEGTVARSHGSNTKWVHSLTKQDLVTSTDLSDGLAEKLDLSGGTLSGTLDLDGQSFINSKIGSYRENFSAVTESSWTVDFNAVESVQQNNSTGDITVTWDGLASGNDVKSLTLIFNGPPSSVTWPSGTRFSKGEAPEISDQTWLTAVVRNGVVSVFLVATEVA